MADVSTITSLATAGGTLVLAVATFSAVMVPRVDIPHPGLEQFRPQTRDLYVTAGDTGFWLGSVREPEDPFRPGLGETLSDGEMLTVDLFYGDHEGGQGTIGRFIFTPGEEDGQWHCSVVRHWVLEGVDPRERYQH